IHESLSLARFDSTWVQLMLPYRMPRAPHAGGQDSGLLRNLLCPWLLPLLHQRSVRRQKWTGRSGHTTPARSPATIRSRMTAETTAAQAGHAKPETR
ncbi:MAG: hypothetical protein KDK91_17660, partial [Gammaproteobacteria bacterium]|nr:hypothetical protein [Gammaproteobacteria bacterium]